VQIEANVLTAAVKPLEQPVLQSVRIDAQVRPVRRSAPSLGTGCVKPTSRILELSKRALSTSTSLSTGSVEESFERLNGADVGA